MLTRKRRVAALEKSIRTKKHKTALVLILFNGPTPEQQDAIDEANRQDRPVLLIHVHGHNVDFGQSDEIVPAREDG